MGQTGEETMTEEQEQQQLPEQCYHDWTFLERWLSNDPKKTRYVFFCSHCLALRYTYVFFDDSSHPEYLERCEEG